jgi:alkanesulfonate monooxygenase SsuD/methylene tetrahydromethanopterin reductase-like flavin-dependent oxidoreductase (luciferase family)
VPALLIDDVQAGRDVMKEYYSFYIGGMGARGKNFYNDLFTRYGYEAEANEIQELFLGGQQREAAGKVPDAFVDEVALIGPVERIRDRLAAWRESGATTLLVSTRDEATLRAVAQAAGL